jgi:hypothetical protein
MIKCALPPFLFFFFFGRRIALTSARTDNTQPIPQGTTLLGDADVGHKAVEADLGRLAVSSAASSKLGKFQALLYVSP